MTFDPSAFPPSKLPAIRDELARDLDAVTAYMASLGLGKRTLGRRRRPMVRPSLQRERVLQVVKRLRRATTKEVQKEVADMHPERVWDFLTSLAKSGQILRERNLDCNIWSALG